MISTTLTLASATRFSMRVLYAMVSFWMITSSVACALVTALSSRPCFVKRTMPCYSRIHVREGKNSLATSHRHGTCHTVGVQPSTLIGAHRPPIAVSVDVPRKMFQRNTCTTPTTSVPIANSASAVASACSKTFVVAALDWAGPSGTARAEVGGYLREQYRLIFVIIVQTQ